MTQTLYFITQNGQPISMETWTDQGKADAHVEFLNSMREPSDPPYEVRSRVSSDNVSSDNASEATPITVTMGLPGATGKP